MVKILVQTLSTDPSDCLAPRAEPGTGGAKHGDAPDAEERPGAGRSVLGPGQDRPPEDVQPRVGFPFRGLAASLHTAVTAPPHAVLRLTSW